MVNYATDLQYLFQSNDAKKPYNIDNLLFQLISESGFTNTVNINGYLKDVSTVDIKREDSDVVRKFIGIVLPGESPLPANVQAPAPQQTYSFTDDATVNDVFITITPAANLSGSTYSKIITDVTTSNSTSDDVVKDHTQFRNYLFDIIEDVVKYNFDEAKKKLGTLVYNLPDSDPRQNVYDPVVFLYNMKITRLGSLIKNLRDACVLAFKELLDKSPVVTSGNMTDFRNGGFNSKLYYDLRSAMINKLDVKTFYNNIDENQVIYFKKVVTDMFLKTCYPLVHMLSMQAMLEWYANQGDYVNVRVIVLAMTYYVFYTLKALYTMNVSIQPNQFQLNQANMNNLNIIFNKLTAYITNNNKINVNSESTANDEMKNLVIDLHDLSRNVSNANKDIQHLKKAIKDNQLAMRNILFNIEVKRKEYNRAKTEFIVVLIILLLFTVLNVVLLIMKMPTIVYYTSGFVGIAAVAYLIVMIIISFIKGGNK